MFDNLQIELHRHKSYAWRWMFGGGLFAVAFFLNLVAFQSSIPRDVMERSAVLRTLNPMLPHSLIAKGGDSTVDPPKNILLPQISTPKKIGDAPPPEHLTAPEILVRDQKSGAILYESHAYDRRPMASITKLMSAIIILERRPEWTVTTTVASDDVEDTHMYAGDTYSLSDLWHAALIGSSNKAVLSLVDALGWTREQFVARMNEKARELAMTSTLFADPTGLDENNMANAIDIATLLGEALKHQDIRSAVSSAGFDLFSKERKAPHHMWNTDWLLLGWIPHRFSVAGGKTGYIPSAGYNFAVQISKTPSSTVDVVVLGATSNESRFIDARDIANWVFANYEWPK